MNSNNVTSHEILDPKKRPNDANELLLFSDTSINNETHSNEILQIRMVTGSIIPSSVFCDTQFPYYTGLYSKYMIGNYRLDLWKFT